MDIAMPLSCSNIGWSAADDEGAYRILIDGGFRGVEVAPTRCWPNWAGADRAAAIQLRQRLQTAGLVCPALQSLFFGVQGISVFGSPAMQSRMLEHLDKVAAIAQGLGATRLVFGAPALRDKGDLSATQASAVAEDFFRSAAERLLPTGVCLCIEPNPPQYGCNFITTAAEGAALVRRVGSPAFRLHLDVGGMFLAGDEVEAAIESSADVLAHVHASEPELGTFEQPRANHAGAARALRRIGWKAWVSVEMKAVAPASIQVATAVQRVSHFYREFME